MKVIVIGAGASGLICAITLARRGINVEIIFSAELLALFF